MLPGSKRIVPPSSLTPTEASVSRDAAGYRQAALRRLSRDSQLERFYSSDCMKLLVESPVQKMKISHSLNNKILFIKKKL